MFDPLKSLNPPRDPKRLFFLNFLFNCFSLISRQIIVFHVKTNYILILSFINKILLLIASYYYFLLILLILLLLLF